MHAMGILKSKYHWNLIQKRISFAHKLDLLLISNKNYEDKDWNHFLCKDDCLAPIKNDKHLQDKTTKTNEN